MAPKVDDNEDAFTQYVWSPAWNFYRCVNVCTCCAHHGGMNFCVSFNVLTPNFWCVVAPSLTAKNSIQHECSIGTKHVPVETLWVEITRMNLMLLCVDLCVCRITVACGRSVCSTLVYVNAGTQNSWYVAAPSLTGKSSPSTWWRLEWALWSWVLSASLSRYCQYLI